MSTDTPTPDIERNGPKIVEPDDVPLVRDFAGPFFDQIAERKNAGRDAKILVTADDAATGVGKTNLCDFLGYMFDTTEAGFNENKVAIEPERFFERYKTVEEGSAMILEEAEQLDSRRHMSQENVEASQVWQKGRVREVIALLNLPSPKFIDKRMEELADYWINVECRGRARIYKKKIHRIKQSVYYRAVQEIEWPNMDGSTTFGTMEDLKWEHIEDPGETGWVDRQEHLEEIERMEKQTRRDVRNNFLCALSEETELLQREIAELSPVDINQGQVSKIVNEDDDNES